MEPTCQTCGDVLVSESTPCYRCFPVSNPQINQSPSTKSPKLYGQRNFKVNTDVVYALSKRFNVPPILIVIISILFWPLGIVLLIITYGGTRLLKILILGLVGFLVGGLIGFSLRPSYPFIGQLSFDVVIGSNLHTLDEFLVPLARESFNYMVTGAVIGSIGGLILGFVLSQKKDTYKSLPEKRVENHPAPPKTVELGNTSEQVEAVLGQPEKIVNLGGKVIHIYKDMKVIYIDGKVLDVQL